MLTNITTLAASESGGSGLSALGVDAKAFIIQLITFVLVFFVLKKYAFKPILKILAERRETIEAGVALGEEMRREKSQTEQKMADMLQEARKEADEIISNANDTGREAIKEAEEKAKLKAGAVVDEAHRRIDQDAARVRKQLESELIGLVADATEAVIEEKVDAKKDEALIKRALKETA